MKKILTLLFFIICLQSHSQVHDYYVFLVKGEALVSKTHGTPVLLKQNSLLHNGQVVIIKKGTEVTLAGKNQECYVLNIPGTYKLKDLDKEKPDPVSGVTKTYLKLIWNELFHPNDDFKTFTNNNNAMAYGGVSRGFECNNLIFPINGLKTSSDTLHFKWHQTSPSSKYTFFIYDGEGKDVAKIAIKDTQLTINKNQFSGSKTGKYYWLVKSDDATCEDEVPIYFELMTKNDEAKLISSLITITGNEDLQNKFQIIETLEKKGMIYSAADFYQSLIKENPDDEALRKSCVLFLLKYGFDEEATVAWDAQKK